MTRQRLRVFVSSPGDVMAAREVAAQVIEKLAHEYARFFAVEPYLWEYEPMLASGHFQDSIDPPSSFDVVILILESRLGTPLPERTAVREYRGMDGRSPVTGTEWEFEDALVAARAHGTPDLLVYRSSKRAEVDTWDAQSRQLVLRNLEQLDAFWTRHFTDRGTFLTGFNKFRTLDELAAKLEHDVRTCLQRRIERLRPEERAPSVRLWATAPFRGLESYEFEHAAIFFGREEIVGTALLRLITNAQEAQPFLLVLGASGSGKSSLVKAGLLPRLLVPQRVSGLAFLRRVVFRPGEAQVSEDLFDALARVLTGGDGETTGLREMLGTAMPAKELARHLRESSAHPDLPFAMVLDRLAEAARAHGRMLHYEQPRLVLEVDQLEELFTAERVLFEERKRFLQLLAALVRSGLVWIVATMRADFWHRAAEVPELIQLADGPGRLDLLPPTPAELSQMIRGPAEAAAIRFESHPVSGIPLNDEIAAAATGEPGTLPLLSYLLDQLYRRDIEDAGGDTLTYASYNALGGLKGAIATRAEAVLASQPPDVRAALRAVLFSLVQMSATEGSVERAVARRAPLSDFPEGTAKHQLVRALLDPAARLLVAEAAGGDAATVRLAHEALINEWQAARDYVAGNAEALRVRRRLEERYARWRSLSSESTAKRGLAGKLRALFSTEPAGLLTDLDLTDAKRLLRDYRDELTPELVGYAERSTAQDRRRRKRSLRFASAVAAVLGVLAVGATYEARLASVQSRRAEVEATTAEETSRFLVDLFRVADPSEARGSRVTAREMLDKGSVRLDRELASQPAIQARLFDTIGTAYMGLGLYDQAAPLLEKALALRRAQLPQVGSRTMLIESLNHVAELETRRADFPAAERTYREAISLSAGEKGRSQLAISRTVSLHELGTVLAQEGRYPDADRSLREALASEHRLGLDSSDEAARTLQDLAKVVEQSGDIDKAIPLMERAVSLHRSLHGTDPYPAFAEAVNDLGYLKEQQGDHRAAQALFMEALQMKRRLFGEKHPEVAAGLANLGIVANDEGDFARAEMLYRQALAMQRELLGENHPDVADTLNNLAFVQADRGDLPGAVSSEREALQIYRHLFPGDHPEVARIANRLGLWLIREGAYPEADTELTGALAMRERLLGPDHPDVASSLTHLAILQVARHEFAAALARADRAGKIYRSTSSPDWKIAITDTVGGAALVGLGRLDDGAKRLDQGLVVLRSKDSAAPAAYLQIAEGYSRDLQQQRGHGPKVSVAKSAS
jgi:tetratricopeptide (TPR) repeat protein